MPDEEGHPAVEEIELGRVLSALADPLRRRVVRELAAAPDGTARTCSSFALPVSKATVTHHFRTLRESGLVRQVDGGNSRMASLRRDEIEARFPGLLAILLAEGAAGPATGAVGG
ncbi:MULTISPECIES: helix-turn-helix transcriptional regulator [unclassified Kitasatospora]|uniref:ArsR/SmtB family transcription factor n=1 Tax=unclassified Kitasatospora TaxID=2633591 RepID=UPI001ADEE9DE|nr:helix-turn-helix domain-containing protein [Kitasatospora sp. RG8]MBP0450070.1 helix-turn-helix transcriptional regulator [Kitasatospora sp. RG8]